MYTKASTLTLLFAYLALAQNINVDQAVSQAEGIVSTAVKNVAPSSILASLGPDASKGLSKGIDAATKEGGAISSKVVGELSSHGLTMSTTAGLPKATGAAKPSGSGAAPSGAANGTAKATGADGKPKSMTTGAANPTKKATSTSSTATAGAASQPTGMMVLAGAAAAGVLGVAALF